MTVAGSAAYQRRPVPDGICEVDLPLSPTRSVRLVSSDRGGDLSAGCATTRLAAERVADALARPVDRRRPGDVTGARDACDLLRSVPGADMWDSWRADADSCGGAFAGGYVSMSVEYGEVQGEREEYSAEGEPNCTVTFAADRRPDTPALRR